MSRQFARQTPPASHQPIFNLPRLVVALILMNVGIFAALHLLPEGKAESLLMRLALIPARDSQFIWSSIPPFFTHAFTHVDFTHLILNMAFLAAIGAGVQRRIGSVRFIIYYLICAVAGGLTELILVPDLNGYLIGASGAVSGLMGAIVHFAIRRDRRIGFIFVWLLANLILGFAAPSIFNLDGSVAWQAHIGGFFTGLIIFPLFDRKFYTPPKVKSGP